MKQSLTYKDIIDDKIAEWQSGLAKLEDQAFDAPEDIKREVTAKFKKLENAVDSAIEQLYSLDEQETAANTLETKDQILKIFSSIDKDFLGGEGTTPFML